MMTIRTTEHDNRKAWELDNGAIRLTVLAGGGHIASLVLTDKPDVNPLWNPVWKGIEPWQYRNARDARRYESRLLASIRGHNLCLGHFGGASDSETAAGLGPHGEAPVARWRMLRRSVTSRSISMTCGCDLPIVGMRFERTLRTKAASHTVHVRERLHNLRRCDTPFTMCQHVTIAAPFLEKGVTVFDMPATLGHTFPWFFEDRPRMKRDTAYRWPDGPGLRGETVDLRMIAKRYRVSSDYSTNLIDPQREHAWFSAVNPRQGVLLAYRWNRADFPWVGNWEENFGRKQAPWSGNSLSRGMEFANTPFPLSLRQAVDLHRFHDHPTYRWLPARATIAIDYDILLQPVDTTVRGVKDVTQQGGELVAVLA